MIEISSLSLVPPPVPFGAFPEEESISFPAGTVEPRRLSENRLTAHFSEKSLEVLQNITHLQIVSQRKYSDIETWMMNDNNNIWAFLY